MKPKLLSIERKIDYHLCESNFVEVSVKRVFVVAFAFLAAAACSESSSVRQNPAPPVASPALAKDVSAEAKRIFRDGQAALNQGDLDRAEAAFRKVLQLDRNSAAARANLGVVEMRRKQWDRALVELREAQRLAPRMTGIRINIGLVEYRRANYAAAIPPFESALRDDPELLQPRYLLGLCYTFVERPADAVRTLEPLWPKMSDQFVYLYVLANAAFRSGNRAVDEKALERLVEVGRDTPEFHLFMGKALLNHDDDQKALDELQKAAAANPNLPFLHFYLGILYRRVSQPELAEKEFRKDIELEPDTGYNYEQLGKLYVQMGRHDEAEKAFRDALAQEPRLPASLTELAKFELRRGETDEALKKADRAEKLAPETPGLHFVRAQILERMGRKVEAKAEFAAARKSLVGGLERDRARSESETVPDPELARQP